MIPGLNAELPLRAKVRVGERDSNGNPRALTHFTCEEPSFYNTVESPAKALRIRLPYPTLDECFPTSLERWVKSKAGNPILSCYSKTPGTALRRGNERDARGDVVMNPSVVERLETPCRDRQCEWFGKKGCGPQGRLNFFLDGDPIRDSVWRLETKSWFAIEQIVAVLRQFPDLRQPLFELYVERRQKGNKKFVVVGIREILSGNPTVPQPAETGDSRKELKRYLVASDRWPMSAEQIEWVKEVTPAVALATLRKRDAA